MSDLSDQEVDEILRRGLTEIVAHPDSPAPTRHDHGRSERILATIVATIATVGVLTAMAVAIVLGHSRPLSKSPSLGAPATHIVPWAALPASVTSAPPAKPPALPECTPAELNATALAFAGGATSTIGYSGTITLVGTSPCYLPSAPSAALIDAAGVRQSIPTNGQAAGPASGFPVLSPSASASVSLQIYGYCSIQPVTRLGILLGGAQWLYVPVGRYPQEPSSAASLCPDMSVSWLLLITSNTPATPSPSIGLPPGLTASLSAPAIARAGESYRYLVTLRNATTSPISLNPCPTYGEGLKGPNGEAFYTLNCPAATPVPANGSEVFEMYLPIPSSIPAGVYRLGWLVENSSSFIGATTSVTISS